MTTGMAVITVVVVLAVCSGVYLRGWLRGYSKGHKVGYKEGLGKGAKVVVYLLGEMEKLREDSGSLNGYGSESTSDNVNSKSILIWNKKDLKNIQ